MAIVDDFKDIASRMKGELKARSEPLAPDYVAGVIRAIAPPTRNWPPPVCGACGGHGENPPNSVCSSCGGKGTL